MKKFEKKRLVIIGSIVSVASFLLRMIMPTTPWWVYLMAAVAGFGAGAYSVVLPVMTLECNEIVEYKIGRRAEATIGAINTFFVKIGGTLAVVIPAWILASRGFDTNLASFSATNPAQYTELYGSLYVPSTEATGAIIFSTHVLPALFYIVALVLLMFWHHSKSEHEIMMQELNARREKYAALQSQD